MDGVIVSRWRGRQSMALLWVIALAATSTTVAVTVPTWFVLYAILLVLLFVPPTLDLLTGCFDLMEARNVVIGYYFLDFGLGIVNDVFLGQREAVSQAEFNRMLPVALACVDISLVLFYLGYYSPIGPRLASACPRLNPNWKRPRINLVIALSAVAGLVAYLLFVADAGGLTAMFSDEMQLAASQLGKYYLVLAAFRLPLLATLLCYLWARTTGSRNHRLATIALFTATFAMGATMGARGAPLRTVLACGAAAYYIPARRRFSRTARASVAAVTVLALVIVIPLQTAIRAGRYFPGLSTTELISQAYKSESASGELFLQEFMTRFMAYEELVRILDRTGSSVEPQAGKTFLETFYGLVPRALWPEKPDGVPMVAGEVFLDHAAVGQVYWFPTMTWPGELYWNFFWPGIIFGMIASGISCRAVYAYFRSNLNISGVLLYIPTLLFFEVFAIGGLGALVVESMVLYVPIVGIYFALTV